MEPEAMLEHCSTLSEAFAWWSLSFLCSPISQLTAELVSERVQQVGDGLLHTDISEQLGAQRCHAFILDTTWHNVFKPRQVRVTVEGQAVRRDVATAVDSCQSTVSDPWEQLWTLAIRSNHHNPGLTAGLPKTAAASVLFLIPSHQLRCKWTCDSRLTLC